MLTARSVTAPIGAWSGFNGRAPKGDILRQFVLSTALVLLWNPPPLSAPPLQEPLSDAGLSQTV